MVRPAVHGGYQGSVQSRDVSGVQASTIDGGRRPSAIRVSDTFGQDSKGRFRVLEGKGLGIFKTIRGGCIHVATCRHLRCKTTGAMWKSNEQLTRCQCVTRLYSGHPYCMSNKKIIHGANTCVHWRSDETLVGSLTACEICTRG